MTKYQVRLQETTVEVNAANHEPWPAEALVLG